MDSDLDHTNAKDSPEPCKQFAKYETQLELPSLRDSGLTDQTGSRARRRADSSGPRGLVQERGTLALPGTRKAAQ